MKNIIAIAVALAFSTGALAQAPKAAEPAKAAPATPATAATPATPAKAAAPAAPAKMKDGDKKGGGKK